MSLSGRLLLVIELLIFKVLIEFIYVYQIVPHYSYMGFIYSGFDWGKVIVSYAAVLWAGFFLPRRSDSVSRIFFSYAFVFLFVPIASLFWLVDWVSFSAFLVAWLFFGGAAVALNFRFKTLFVSDVLPDRDLFLLILVIFSILTLLFFVAKFGGNLKALSLLKVYSARTAYKEQTDRILGYLVNWQGNVINPYFFVLGIVSGNLLFTLFAIIFQYYIFTFTGFRSIFFSFLFVLWFLAGLRFYKESFVRFILESSSLFFIMLIILYKIAPVYGTYASSIGVRRTFYMPALVYYQYFDFFEKNPKDHFSRNFPFKLFYSSQYEEPIPYLMGKKYYGKKETHVNGNIIADAFANFGYAGVFVVWFLFMLILKFMDDFTRYKSLPLMISLFAMPFFSLTNMSFITVLITHGLLLALILAYFHPTKMEK